MTNPLLQDHVLPLFESIEPSHVRPAIEEILEQNRALIESCLARKGGYTYENLVEPLEHADDRLNRAWSPVSHLNAVSNSDALREVYNETLPLLSAYATEVGQNDALFDAYRSIADSEAYCLLDVSQKKIIDNALRDFRLSGVDLPKDKKARFKEIAEELTRLSSQFQDNVLDATQGWHRHLLEERELVGLSLIHI